MFQSIIFRGTFCFFFFGGGGGGVTIFFTLYFFYSNVPGVMN